MRSLLAVAGTISLVLFFSITDDGYARCAKAASFATCHSTLNR